MYVVHPHSNMIIQVRNTRKLWQSVKSAKDLNNYHSKTLYQNQKIRPYSGPGLIELRHTIRPSKLNMFQESYYYRFLSTKPKFSESSDNPEPAQNNPKLILTEKVTRAEKLKKAVKEYGSTVIVFHVGISLISLGTCYLLVSAGLDITAVFNTLGLQEWASKSQIAASAGTFAVAYAVHKVFAPMRIAITLGSVPLIVRYLRRIGFLRK